MLLVRINTFRSHATQVIAGLHYPHEKVGGFENAPHRRMHANYVFCTYLHFNVYTLASPPPSPACNDRAVNDPLLRFPRRTSPD